MCSDVDHGFTNASGGNYSPQAAEEAWATTLEFLAEQLGRQR
jgi:dienelactone hydrolase